MKKVDIKTRGNLSCKALRKAEDDLSLGHSPLIVEDGYISQLSQTCVGYKLEAINIETNLYYQHEVDDLIRELGYIRPCLPNLKIIEEYV